MLKVRHGMILSWGILGFYRGIKHYDYNQTEKSKKLYVVVYMEYLFI